ncbi:delta(7)-sterol 5(6)-desaturase erg32-like [Actinia tenebrosa]|uniref:Delta(7)-sterol 5(6)-desaturase erg32-like n=1 Tax=Actinia tenebrosa TaxID=6105 RepID=A0A6P8J4J5_ACTTE|nr:delta(7)-sterol 5(6)-desaturase erg32-like [Actinia tenebrosa]
MSSKMRVFGWIPSSEMVSQAFVDKFSIFWRYMPGTVGIVVAGIITMILGSALRGEWTLVLVLACKQLGIKLPASQSVDDDVPGLMESIGLKDVHWHILTNVLSSTVIYFTLGGFLQWYFYIRQRGRPEDWKCQPKRFLSREEEIHEITLGTINMMSGAAVFGVISCYIANGGFTTLYYDPLERGWLYLFLSTILLFLFEDACAYYYHRMLHWPFFYKRFHKIHHRYKAPTAFSATAMHPVEFFGFQVFIIAPVFIMPINAGVYVGILMYLYYFGMVDHSGINMYSIVPWQPPVMFHDDHHKYFHCNFGFNSLIFDQFHGTLRRTDRFYSEDTFGGKGKPLNKAQKAQKELLETTD